MILLEVYFLCCLLVWMLCLCSFRVKLIFFSGIVIYKFDGYVVFLLVLGFVL